MKEDKEWKEEEQRGKGRNGGRLWKVRKGKGRERRGKEEEDREGNEGSLGHKERGKRRR